MKMTWRWYGEGNDQIKLSDIKQIPGVEGIVWALHDKMPGEVWLRLPAGEGHVVLLREGHDVIRHLLGVLLAPSAHQRRGHRQVPQHGGRSV